MTLKTERSYSIKDADLLLASSTIVENAIAEKDFLTQKRSTWKDPFFEDLKKRIDYAIQNNLGYDTSKDLRTATSHITKVQADAVRDLGTCKVQIVEDFKKDPVRRDQVLTELGFYLYPNVRKPGSQQETFGLLSQFKKNMTGALRNEIVEKGTAPELIDAIVAHADFLHNANVAQETQKGTRKVHTMDNVSELNEIYSDIISVCKIASKLLEAEPHKKDLFNFTRICRQISGRGAALAKSKAAKAVVA